MRVSIADIRAAEAAVYRVAHRTPLLHSSVLSKQFGCPLYVKAECLQRTGSFKAGAALAVKSALPGVWVAGVQAAGAPAAARSFRAGRRLSVDPAPTLADGVAIAAPGRRTLPLIRQYVDEIVTVDEESIAQAIAL